MSSDELPEPAGSPVDVTTLITAVNNLDATGSDTALIDQITLLEHLKSSCAAAQATLTHAFTTMQHADGAAHHVPTDLTRRSIAGQIALARHESRHRGGRLLALAGALVTDTPQLLAALRAGQLSERRADLIITEFACLTPADRVLADTLIGPDLPTLGDRSATARAATIAARLDPEAVLGKIRGAVTDRHVSSRPAPNTMSRLSALLPVVQGVAVYAALHAAAGAAAAAPGGDSRTRGQLMADALVSLITGQHLTGCDPYGVPTHPPAAAAATTHAAAQGNADPTTDINLPVDADRPTDTPADDHADEHAATDVSDPNALNDAADDDVDHAATDVSDRSAMNDADDGDNPADAGGRSGCACGHPAARTGGWQLNLIMTDRTLFGDDDEPAHLHGHGPIPAPLARALIIHHADTSTRTFLRRLYTNPDTGQLVAMDSQQRLFPAGAQRFLIARDQTCRTPWCDAPIRHLDHIVPHADGGPTSISNGQGLCQSCNFTKQAPGWRSSIFDALVRITTPTGHTYTSLPPPPPTSPPWPKPDISTIEATLAEILLDVA